MFFQLYMELTLSPTVTLPLSRLDAIGEGCLAAVPRGVVLAVHPVASHHAYVTSIPAGGDEEGGMEE